MTKSTTSETFFEDEYVTVLEYARSSEGQAKIAQAQAEIDEAHVSDREPTHNQALTVAA